MNEEQKDKGLKKAIKEENGFRLPSNFAYHTMRKVEEAIRLREKKSERRTLFATIAASIFLIGCCIAGLVIYFGNTIPPRNTGNGKDSNSLILFTDTYRNASVPYL